MKNSSCFKFCVYLLLTLALPVLASEDIPATSETFAGMLVGGHEATEASASFAQTQAPKPNAEGKGQGVGKTGYDEPTAGDPIGCISGAAKSSAVDIVVRCPGVDLVFQRVYNSSLTKSSGLGYRWTHSYDWRLVPSTDGKWMMLCAMADPARSGGCSSFHHFEHFDDGTYSMSDADHYLLTQNTEGTYDVSVPGDRTYHFGGDGILDAISHISGATVTLTYENRSTPSTRRLVGVEHSNGKALTFSYDETSISSIAVPSAGYRVDYAYTNVVVYSPGLASVVSELMESSWPLGYSSQTPRDYLSHDPSLIPYRNSLTLASATRVSDGLTSTMTYNYSKDLIKVTPIYKEVLVTIGSLNGNPIKEMRLVGFPFPEYDSFLTEKTDANGITAYFDYAQLSDAVGSRVNYTVMDGGLYETELDFFKGRTEMITYVAGKPVKTTLLYDPLTKREKEETTGSETVKKSYNDYGDLSRVVVSDTNTTAYLRSDMNYGTWHNVTNMASGYCKAPRNFWTLSWNQDWLMPQKIVSPEGRISQWEIEGRIMSVYGGGTNSLLDTVLYNCDTNWRVNTIVNANQHQTSFFYNDLGYLARIASPGLREAAFDYDALGHVQKVSVPGPAASVRELTLTNNPFGRPLRITYPDGTEESFKYDGNWKRVVESVDALGRTNVYDWVLGVPVLAKQFPPDHPEGVPMFSITHDQQMNTLSISDPLGRLSEAYVLNENERVIAVTNLEGQVMTREFIVGGLVGQIGRYDGTHVDFGYSRDGDLLSVAYPGSKFSFTYDRDGLMLSAAVGAKMVNNEYNEVAWLTKTRGVDGSDIGYSYYPAGQVSNVTSVAGTTDYSLDSADRLAQIADSSGSFAYAYNPWNGFVSAVTNGVGLVSEYQYDIMDRPTNIVWRKSNGSTLAGFGYEYNAVGMITDRTTSLGTNAVSIAYGYDGLDRLVSESESSGVSRTYAYDLVGNRLSKTETGSGAITYALGVGDRLATYTGGSYAYDTAGCVTAIDRAGKPDLDLTWNGQYQLTSVSTNGVVAESYTYDPLGRRYSTTSGGTTLRHVYDGIHCVADIDSVGRVVKSYTWGPGIDNLLAVTCHSGTLATTYYALTDLQGTVHGFADAGGNLVARYAYDAWGNLLDADVVVSELADNRYLFQGREYSYATGLTNFRARWYDPVTARWLSKDPIGLDGGINLYVYCGNDPVNFRDPYGLVNWGLVGRGFLGVVVNGAMAVGGAFLAETGVGAAVAYYGAYQTGASVGNIINGFRDAPEGPSGPAQAISQVGMLVGGVDPNSRAWARGDFAAQTVDVIVPTILAGRIDTRLVLRRAGPAGSPLGILQHVYIPPEQASGLVRAGVIGDGGLLIYDYGKFVWDEFNVYENDDCGKGRK